MDRNIEPENDNSFEQQSKFIRESNVLERLIFYIDNPRIFIKRLVISFATLDCLL